MKIKLRKLVLEDASDLFEYGSNPENVKFVTWGPYKNIDDAKNFISNIYDPKKVFAIEFQDKMVGTIGVVKVNKRNLFIGYILNLKFAKQGIMLESLTTFIELTKEKYPNHKIKATTLVENIPSKNLLLKFGFKKIKTITHNNSKLYLFELN